MMIDRGMHTYIHCASLFLLTSYRLHLDKQQQQQQQQQQQRQQQQQQQQQH